VRAQQRENKNNNAAPWDRWGGGYRWAPRGSWRHQRQCHRRASPWRWRGWGSRRAPQRRWAYAPTATPTSSASVAFSTLRHRSNLQGHCLNDNPPPPPPPPPHSSGVGLYVGRRTRQCREANCPRHFPARDGQHLPPYQWWNMRRYVSCPLQSWSHVAAGHRKHGGSCCTRHTEKGSRRGLLCSLQRCAPRGTRAQATCNVRHAWHLHGCSLDRGRQSKGVFWGVPHRICKQFFDAIRFDSLVRSVALS
jgi:hypothetical protein